MVCKNCGAVLPDVALFCEICGNKVIGNTKPAEKKKNKKSILRGFLSAVCCFFILVTTLLILVLVTVRGSIKSGIVKDFVHGFDVTVREKSVNVSDFLESLTGVKYDDEQIEQIVDRTSITEIFAGVIDDYAEAIIDGEDPEEVVETHLKRWVKDNENVIEDVTGYRIRQEDYARIETLDADEYFEFLHKNKSLTKYTQLFSKIFSVSTLIILYIIVAVFLMLLIIIRRRRDTLIWNGITLLISGGIFLLPMLVIILLQDYLFNFNLTVFIKGVLSNICINSGLTIIAGIACIITYIVTGKIFKAKEG